jgi:hypothetical protein
MHNFTKFEKSNLVVEENFVKMLISVMERKKCLSTIGNLNKHLATYNLHTA